MSPSDKAAPETVADRLADAKRRMDANAGALKWYRLSIVLRPHGPDTIPAPFTSVTIGTPPGVDRPSLPVTFAEYRMPMEADARTGKPRQVEHVGSVQRLTASDVAAVRARIKDYIVRWRVRVQSPSGPQYDASILDGALPQVRATLNPETDEPIEPYLSIEGPFDAPPS